MSKNVIVNYLPPGMSANDLLVLFSTCGTVESCKLMKNLTTGESLCYGFVKYEHEEEAQRAIHQLNGHMVIGRHISVSRALSSGDDRSLTNLFVTNMPRNYEESDLERLFGPFGRLERVKLLRSFKNGQSMGVAFVRYYTKEEARFALRMLNGVYVDEDARLLVRMATPYENGYNPGFLARNQRIYGNSYPPAAGIPFLRVPVANPLPPAGIFYPPAGIPLPLARTFIPPAAVSFTPAGNFFPRAGMTRRGRARISFPPALNPFAPAGFLPPGNVVQIPSPFNYVYEF